MVQVEEVVGRAEQGVTQPFICRADDGRLYYVKGRGAGYASLAKELIAGRLAQRFGLPIAEFAILDVPRDLFQAGADSDLGHGLVSKAEEGVNEINITNLASMEAALKRDIAAFDWWILNADRTLSVDGGNPNPLGSIYTNKALIIDHNLAFDDSVALGSLEATHIFGQDLAGIVNSDYLRRENRERFAACTANLHELHDEVPERWHFVDDRLAVKTGFTFDRAEATIRRFDSEDIWERK